MANISAPTAPIWLAGSDCTFEDALLIGQEVTEKTFEMLPTLPRKDASRYLPATVSDALSLVHAREDAKKKNAGNKVNKAKQKSGAAALFGPDERIPGAKQGGGDPGVFWLYSEDFFRDATQEDLHDIIPLLAAPKDDPAFAIGPPGSGAELPAMSHRRPVAPIARPLPPPPPPNPFASADGGILPDDALLGLLERRSSRRASKSGTGGGTVKYNEGDDQDGILDREQEEAYPGGGAAGNTGGGRSGSKSTGGAKSPATRAMKLPITPHGTAASSLWDVVPSTRIALLALQLSELIEFTGGGKLTKEKENPLTQAEKTMAAAAANGKKQLSPAEISQLILFVEERSAALSKTLKCSMDIELLNVRRGGHEIGHANYDDEEKEEEKAGPSTSAAAEAAAAAATKTKAEAAPPSKTSISLPFGGTLHPYTQLFLQSKVPQHVKQAAIEAFGIEPVFAGKTPTAEQLAAGLNADGQPAGTTGAGTGGNNTATTSAAGMATPAGTAPASSIQVGDDEDDVGSAGDIDSLRGSAAGRASSRQRGVSNYALMAGRKDPVKAAAQAAARKLTKDATAAAVAQAAAAHPVSQTVAITIAAGAPDEYYKDVKSASAAQWNVATEDPGLLAVAPQDEIAAETVALQAELAAVAVANRVSLVAALDALLKDVPNQQEGAAMRAAEEAEVIAYYTRIREEKKKELKLRREAAHREALAAAGAHTGILNTPRPVLGHHILAEGDMGGEDGYIEAPFLGPDDMYDVLAQRGEEDEAFCAVCGDGHSHPPNVIIFCDRCDVAVHQMCYDVHEVPENEWLCWPCREYEDMQRAAGVPQAEIRNVHAMPDERTRLPGGSRDVKCALCPIKCGAFRKTTHGERWVHQTCASWHPECYIVPSIGPNCIEGLNKIPSKRWTTACDICGKVDGAVINCKHPGTCQYNFHVMCARNCGLYLTVRPDFQGKPLYRIYCAIHSRGQQEKDAQALAARIEGQSKAAIAANDKALRAQIRETAMLDLAYREDELIFLRQIRVNLENSRLLVDQCKRREKLKKQLVATKHALHAERLQNPLAAVGFLDKIAEMEQLGMTASQILERIPALAEAAGPPPPPPLPEDVYPGLGLTSVDAVKGADDGDGILPGVPSTGKRAREGEVELLSGASPATTDGGGKRARRGQGPDDDFIGPEIQQQQQQEEEQQQYQKPPASAAAAGAGAARPSRSGASGLSIERQKLMSSAEAHDINSKLPPKFKYVPVDQLATEPAQDPRATTMAGAGVSVTVGDTPILGPSPAPSEGGGEAGRALRSRDGSRN